MRKKRPSRQQVLLWQVKKFEKEWDKLYLQVSKNAILQGLMEENGQLVFSSYEELAMYCSLPSGAYAQHCLISNFKDDKEIDYYEKDGSIVIEIIPF